MTEQEFFDRALLQAFAVIMTWPPADQEDRKGTAVAAVNYANALLRERWVMNDIRGWPNT